MNSRQTLLHYSITPLLLLALAWIVFVSNHVPQRQRSGRSSRERKRLLTFNSLLIWGRIPPARRQSKKPEIT